MEQRQRKAAAAWDWTKEKASGVADWFRELPDKFKGWISAIPDHFVEMIDGDYPNIVGLSLDETQRMLAAFD